MFYRRYIKRFFDLSGASVLILVLSPLFFLISAASLIFYQGRIGFTQERVGRYGKRFPMWKFRTMNDVRNDHDELLPDTERTTRFGAFLRRSSLDELPQLFHVITGKMSLVGPRPLLPEHVADCTPAENRRHSVRPGLTGLAQVKGRNRIPFQSRFRYDLWYIDRLSLGLDLYVLWNTAKIIFKKER